MAIPLSRRCVTATARRRRTAPSTGREASATAVLAEATTTLARAVVRAATPTADRTSAGRVAVELATGLAALLDEDAGTANLVRVGSDGRLEALLAGEFNESGVLHATVSDCSSSALGKWLYIPSAC